LWISSKQNEGNPWLNNLSKEYYRRIKIGLKFLNILYSSFSETEDQKSRSSPASCSESIKDLKLKKQFIS